MKRGIDSLLQSQGKGLEVGQEIRFTIVKSSNYGDTSSPQADPINTKAPPQAFPLVAKFPESTVKPDFEHLTRFCQQDVPSRKEDSEDEDDDNNDDTTNKPKKRKWRGRDSGPKRQWVLQQETDYLECQIAKQEQGAAYKLDSDKQSSRYEGVAEYNPSHYVLMGCGASTTKDDEIQLVSLPTPHAVTSFSQPLAAKALSMTQAEHMIQDQRNQQTRYMMHKKGSTNNKMRLLNKLQASKSGDDEADDVMADVKFETRKGTSSSARRELLGSSTNDDAVVVDDQGVLGGAHDEEFGGRRKFGRKQVENDGKKQASAAAADTGVAVFDGMAMQDDFYQRDVKAEYEELDYDANEQFDDDDVDLGEGEVIVRRDGVDYLEYDEDEEEEDEDEEDAGSQGGLASTAGLRAMLAKARGESPTPPEGEQAASDETRTTPFADDSQAEDRLAAVMAAAERAKVAAAAPPADKVAPAQAVTAGAREFDEKGDRILTLEAVRHEVWLHKGTMTPKQLAKNFGIKKKTPVERKQKFQEFVKELCIMTTDPVHGKVLNLKQHYSR